MPRGKRILIKRKIKDLHVERVKNTDLDAIKESYEHMINTLSRNINNVFQKAQKEYNGDKSKLEELGLVDIQTAYEFLRENNYDISFRAFGGRIERGVIPSIKIGRKRYVHLDSLNALLKLRDGLYSVREAYEILKKYDKNINYRAFIGRIEKHSIPSIKIASKRYIPKEIIDSLTKIVQKYYTISQAVQRLKEAGVNIRRNAFERRLDRKRIPHVKIGGKRYIPTDVIDELIEKELGK